MRNISKKVWGLLIGGMILFIFLTGCGNQKDKQTSDRSNQTEEAEREALTITNLNRLFPQEFVDAFYKVYPEVKLKVANYGGLNGSGYAQCTLENGDIPDIYLTTQNFSGEMQKKYLLDLSNYDFVNYYSDALLDSIEVNGSIYLLPSGYTLTGIYYNKTLLKENGWEVPKSFQELVELSKEIEAAGYRTMGNGMILDGFPFNYFFNIGNTVYFGTPEGTEWKEEFPKGEAKAVGNSQLKQTAEYFNKWVENGFISAEHTETSQFFEGECIFFLCLGLSQYEYTNQDGKTYEFGTIPWLSEDGSSNMLTRNVSRYLGINKSLAEKGNEQKLEDALKLLNYISTVEGQQALMTSEAEYMPSLNEVSLTEDSPYQEIADLVREGRTIPLVYVGWEQLIIPIAQDVKQLIQKEIDVDELLAAFDQTADEVLFDSSGSDIYAVAEETLTIEKTAQIVATAEGKAVGADCAMISLNEYRENNNCNTQGLAWYFYKGKINTEKINIVRPRSTTISILKLTGAEIKAMQKAGFDFNQDQNPYPYLLFTKGNIELEDNTLYTLAISTNELTQDRRLDAVETEISPAFAIENYLKELGTIRADEIFWE